MPFNIAEGGTHGTTASTGNTGGDSGTAASSVNIATGDTIKFDTAAAKYGRMGYRFTWLAGGAGATRLAFPHASGVRSVVAFHFKMTTVPTAIEDVAHWRTSGGNVAQIYVNAAGKWAMRDAAGATPAASVSTVSFSANVWYRVEFAAKKGTGTGDGYMGYAIFDLGSNTPMTSWESSVENVGTADLASIAIGRTTGRTQARTIDVDTIRWGDLASGWLGVYTPAFYIRQDGGWRGMESRKVRASGSWV